MLRFEPGDEMRAARSCHFPEAQEGPHLVHVAAYRLRHMLETLDERIGAILERRGIRAKPDEHRVEGGETLRVIMADDAFGQSDEGAGNGESGTARRRAPLVGEQIRCADAQPISDGGTPRGKGAGGLAPAFESSRWREEPLYIARSG